MKRATRWMLCIGCCASQLLGILAFSYDYNTGKASTKPIITLHSALMSIVMFGIIPLLYQVDWNLTNMNVRDLHIKLSGLVSLIRIAAVLVTIVLNWTKRKEFMKTLNDFQRFRSCFLQKWPMNKEVQRKYETSLHSKFILGFISNIFTIGGVLHLLLTQFNVKNPVTALLVAVMGTILYIIMGHFFFAVINVNKLMAVINVEVKRSLQASLKLFQQQSLNQIKPGALITWCCKLTDDLDDLSVAQHRLTNLANHIHGMYDIQITCVTLDVYLTTISCIYITYIITQHEYISEMYSWSALSTFSLALIIYYWDLRVLLSATLSYQSLIKETNQLLIDYQPPLPTLDVRLEDSVSKMN